MNILAPVCEAKEIRPLMVLGCTEFYFGFVPEKWIKKYTSQNGIDRSWIMVSPNKRAGINQSITDYDQAVKLCQTVKKYGKKIYMALNAFSFPFSEYEMVDELVDLFGDELIDGIIVTDVGMIEHLRTRLSKNIKIILSTCQLAINIPNIKFLQKLGVSRVTFTRHMQMKEIESIMKAVPEMEYEVFGIDGKCLYDESNCRAIHCAGQFCMQRYQYEHCSEAKEYSNDAIKNKLDKEFTTYAEWPIGVRKEEDKWPPMGCALCSIYDFKQCNMTTMKISGRGFTLEERMGLVRLTKQAITIAEQSENAEDAKKQIVEMCSKIYPQDYCKKHLGCYITY